MNGYPLEALRRLREREADDAHAAVALRLGEAAATDELRRDEERRLALIEAQISAEDLGEPVRELRALAQAAAHRTRLHAHRASTLAALERAAEAVEEARRMLEQSRSEQRRAVLQQEALAAHHTRWRGERRRAREASEEAGLEEALAARWQTPR